MKLRNVNKAARASAAVAAAERAARRHEAASGFRPGRLLRLAHCRLEYRCGNYEQAAREARELLADLEGR